MKSSEPQKIEVKKTSTAELLIIGNIIIILLLLAPLFCVLIASLIANACGCNINEGGTAECIILGINIGKLLAGVYSIGWLMLVSMMMGPFIIIGYNIIVIISAAIDKGKKKENKSG